MAQLQIHDGNQVTLRAGATEPALREFKLAGDAAMITSDSAQENQLQVCFHAVRSENQQIIEAEEWKIGQRVYWNEGLQKHTILETDTLVGIATRNGMDDVVATNIAKKSGEKSAWINFIYQLRDPSFVAVLDFAGADTPKAQGAYTLRGYTTEPSGNAQMTLLELTHDGNLAPGTATIEIGTLADPDAHKTAIDFTAILALGGAHLPVVVALPTPVVDTPEVVLTISVADATAGRLKIRLVNTKI